MADNFIIVDQTKRLGIQLRRLVDLQREAVNLGVTLKDIMEQQVADPTYTTLEAQFGVPTGKGSTVYNLLTGFNAALNVNGINQFIDYVG